MSVSSICDDISATIRVLVFRRLPTRSYSTPDLPNIRIPDHPDIQDRLRELKAARYSDHADNVNYSGSEIQRAEIFAKVIESLCITDFVMKLHWSD